MKKQVIHVGDKVRIKRALWVERVGYPLVWTMLIDEVESDPRVVNALKALDHVLPTSKQVGLFENVIDLKQAKYSGLVREIAKLRVLERGFGGNERSIHYYPEREHDLYQSAVLEVSGKRVVKTGTRVPSRSGYDSYSGEYWEEQGYLENEKTHILLKTGAGEIEACNVELIDKNSPHEQLSTITPLINNLIKSTQS